jgi:phosphatidate cytidylyltransferase
MSEATRERLFGVRSAFDHPVTRWATLAIALGLAVSVLIIWLLFRRGRIGRVLHDELMQRWRSWLWLVLLMLGPILLGAAWVMAAVAVLSLLCFREYARATGLFREKTICGVIVLGIIAVTFAVADHFDRLFFATAALTTGVIAIVTIPQDRPKGYIQRVALGVLGFLLFGYSFGYMGFIANDANYRPILVMMLLGVELNDVFAFCVGRTLGGPKLIPNTSPGKTVSGSVGALVLTTVLVGGLAHVIFHGRPIDRLDRLALLGAGISVLSQLGDLLLSSIKRDVGVKDLGRAIPGHGGLLDRFDSLVLVPPAVLHFLSLHLGPLGSGQAERIFSGG